VRKAFLLLPILLFVGCSSSDIQIKRKIFTVTCPDENGYSQIVGHLEYKGNPPTNIEYKISNKHTSEKLTGQMKADEIINCKIRAEEKDKIRLTFKDEKGLSKSKSFKVPQVPLYDRLIRQGYTSEQAEEIIYEHNLIRAYRRAAMGRAIQQAGQQFSQSMRKQQYQQPQASYMDGDVDSSGDISIHDNRGNFYHGDVDNSGDISIHDNKGNFYHGDIN